MRPGWRWASLLRCVPPRCWVVGTVRGTVPALTGQWPAESSGPSVGNTRSPRAPGGPGGGLGSPGTGSRAWSSRVWSPASPHLTGEAEEQGALGGGASSPPGPSAWPRWPPAPACASSVGPGDAGRLLHFKMRRHLLPRTPRGELGAPWGLRAPHALRAQAPMAPFPEPSLNLSNTAPPLPV